MEYYVTNDYLAHHGILGMHWGIRRFQPYPKGYHGDGKYTGEGGRDRKAQKRLAKEVSKDASTYLNSGGYRDNGSWKTFSYRTLTFDQPKLKKNPEIRVAFAELSAERQKIKEAGKVFDDFAKLDQKEMLKYLDKAANAAYDNSSDWIKKIYTRKDYVEIYEQEQWFADDESKGPIAQYMKDHGRQYTKEEEKMNKARDAYNTKSQEVTEKLLGEYGNKRVRRGGDSTVKEAVERTLRRMEDEENPITKANDVFFEKVYTNYLYKPDRTKKK